MKTWKILAIVTLVIVRASLVTASAYAYMSNRMGTYAPYGSTTGNAAITYPYEATAE